jgi:hypothetical protein
MALFRGGLKSEKMQTDYLFNGIKGYAYIKRFSYLFEIKNIDNEVYQANNCTGEIKKLTLK